MDPNFYEQLVRKEKSPLYTVSVVFLYVFLIFGVISVVALSLVPAVIFFGLTIIIFLNKGKLYIEYEYIFINGIVDIDSIVEAKKRKKLLSFELASVELIARVDSQYYKDFSNKPGKKVKYYAKAEKEKIFVAMITGGTNRVQLFFTPDEKFLEHCYKKNPRVVKKN